MKAELARYKPKRSWSRPWARRAAVNLLLHEGMAGQSISLFMIKRAQREGDPWSGHMAFPGGMMEATDAHSYAAALRELNEETGLSVDADRACIGKLSDRVARQRFYRRPVVVTPYVLQVDRQDMDWRFDPLEVASGLWIPFDFFNQENRGSMTWTLGKKTKGEKNKKSLQLPCYDYQGHRIWGMSLRMIDELRKIHG